MKDGSVVNEGEKIPGFTFRISSEDLINRLRQKKILDEFFEKCNQNIKSKNKLKFVFTTSGKVLKSLAQISYDTKVVLVSDTLVFIGIIENYRLNTRQKSHEFKKLVDSPVYKSSLKLKNFNDIVNIETENSLSLVTDSIESKFISRNHTSFSPRRKTTYLTDLPKEIHKTSKSPRKLDKSLYISNINNKPKAKEDRAIMLNRLKLKLGEAALLIDRKLPRLHQQGYKTLMKTYGFNEIRLHQLYAKYKMLVLFSVARNLYHDINSGIERSIFIDYMKNGSQEGGDIIGRVFDSIDVNNNGFVS